MTRVLSRETVSVIGCNRNTTFLNVDGRLEVLGHQPPGLEKIVSEDRITECVRVLHQAGEDEAVLLDKDGGVTVVYDVYERYRGAECVEKRPAGGREILHLACGPGFQVMALVTRSNPRTVLTLKGLGSGYGSFLTWYCGDNEENIIDSLDLPSPVKDLFVGYKNITALSESGDVYTWPSVQNSSAISKTGSPASLNQPPTAMASTAPKPPMPEAEEDEEEEGPDMSSLLSDLSRTPSPQETPLAPSSPRYHQVPLPPTTKISRNRTITAAIAASRLYLWLDASETGNKKTSPMISSLGSPSSPMLQDIRDDNGEALPIIDVSVGKAHIVALAADGSLWSVGRGWHGELGVGERMFELGVEEEEGVVYDQEDAVEFTETWLRMDTGGVLGEGMEWGSVVAGEEVTFAVARDRRVVEGERGGKRGM